MGTGGLVSYLKTAAYGNTPRFDSAAACEFLLGKVRKRELRQSFQSYEKRFQLAMLLDCGAIQRHHFWVEL
jgi:hypothetical protein